MKRLAAGFIAILISALPAGVARAGCAPSVDARIDVRIAAEPVETLFDISLQELERLARAAERTAHLPLRAVYTSNVLFGAKIAMQNGDADARSCVTVRSIDLRVKIASRRIRRSEKVTPGFALAGVPTTLWKIMPSRIARISGLNVETTGSRCRP